MIPDTHIMEVIHTTKRVGFNTDQPIHKHDLYFTTDGDLVAEGCDDGFCDSGDGVPIEDLEVLADEWESGGEVNQIRNAQEQAEKEGYEQCVDDLRELIEEHR